MATATRVSKRTVRKSMKKLDKSFEDIGFFDMANREASTPEEGVERAKAHIRWFREWAEESAQRMEQQVRDEFPDHC